MLPPLLYPSVNFAAKEVNLVERWVLRELGEFLVWEQVKEMLVLHIEGLARRLWRCEGGQKMDAGLLRCSARSRVAMSVDRSSRRGCSVIVCDHAVSSSELKGSRCCGLPSLSTLTRV